MATVAEVIYLKINQAANLGDPSSKEGRVFGEFVAATKAIDGVHHFSWGTTEERDDGYNTVCVTEWTGQHHGCSPTSALNEIIDLSLPPITFSTVFQPLPFTDAVFPPNNASSVSPYICELVALAYPAGVDKALTTTRVNDLLSSLTTLTDTAPAHSYTTGFMLNTFTYPDGRAADISYSVVQWQSVEAHMDARGTETFAKYIAPLREDLIFSPWQMRHVRFMKVF